MGAPPPRVAVIKHLAGGTANVGPHNGRGGGCNPKCWLQNLPDDMAVFEAANRRNK